MPGRYIHMDVARKALANLADVAALAPLFNTGGPSAARVSAIARAHPAYVAFGALGPDFFFPYPDWKPPLGLGIWGALKVYDDYMTTMDDLYWGPRERSGMEDLATNEEAIDDTATGGRARERRRRKALALKLTKSLGLGILMNVLPEIFGLTVGNVACGYDEQGFAWSDMLHYRRTYEFAARLWKKAVARGDEKLQAYALGWMCHVATDVTGHGFVNEKCGGPWRLHWQRHSLIENHMDAFVYDDQHGSQEVYQDLSCSALHLWIAFDPDGGGTPDDSRCDFFLSQPGPTYDPGRSPSAFRDRRVKWDRESELPRPLAAFLIETLKDVYGPEATAGPNGQWAEHPRIVNDTDPGSGGFPSVEGLRQNYRLVYRWIKSQTTERFKFLPPEAPPLRPEPELGAFPVPPPAFPPPPPPPDFAGGGPGAGDETLTERAGDVIELGMAIWARLRYLEQVAEWAGAVLEGWNPANAIENWVKRWLEYTFLDLPLYNAMLSLHWFMAMNAIGQPLKHEINRGLTTLGAGVDEWASVRAFLDDPRGGLDRQGPAAGAPEPSGRNDDGTEKGRGYPRDAVTDPWYAVGKVPRSCEGTEQAPSEYLRPWLFPVESRTRRLVPTERPRTVAGPHRGGQDARVLMDSAPGDAEARQLFEDAGNEADTIALGRLLLPQGRHLGDPVDYTAYVVARLTRDDPGPIANFNLDADRSYGTLCWDWVRSAVLKGTPGAWTGGPLRPHLIHPEDGQPKDPRAYAAPLRPGFGWCADDLAEDNDPAVADVPDAERPRMHDTAALPNDPGQVPVTIRYLDREPK